MDAEAQMANPVHLPSCVVFYKYVCCLRLETMYSAAVAAQYTMHTAVSLFHILPHVQHHL